MLVTSVIIVIFYLFYVSISEDDTPFIIQIVCMLCLAGLINLLEWIFGLSSTQAFFVIIIGAPIGVVIVMHYFDKENKN